MISNAIDAKELVAIIDAVPRIDYCECARPRSEHKYWVDRIYDYNGYACPNSPIGGDYRHSVSLTDARYLEARIVACSDFIKERSR